MSKKTHVMLDLETLSLEQNAVVTAIGAVVFDPFTGETDPLPFYTRLDIFPQLVVERAVDIETIKWWKTQHEALKQQSNDPTVSTVEALNRLLAWMSTYIDNFDNICLWGNGKEFDNVILRNLYKDMDITFPLPYWADMDVRTITQLIDYDDVKINAGDFKGVKHHPLDDCNYQVKLVYEGLKLIKGLK